MTVLFCGSTNKKITLTNQIARSGEGTVWNTDWSGYLAKVYHSPHHERVNKLEVMVTHPPKEPNSHLNHFSFAWPKSLLKDSNGWVLGFLMPAIREGKELIDIYNPHRRQQLGLEINWYFLHATAMNIASIIQALHVEGYVLGDIKSQNILVNNCALPSIIDTDSFQVCHPNTGEIYRCLVGSEGFTPVELMGKDFHITDQTEVHDRFRLAVIIYHLLFGNHPFQGRWTGAGDSPDTNQLINQGFWPYAPNSLIELGLWANPLNIVHSQIQQCFKRCFNDGHTKPDLRPTAGEWVKALKVAIADLTPCSQMTNHYHSLSYGKCYWCEYASKLGIDIFPDVTIQPQSRTTSSSSQFKVLAADNIAELVKHKGQEITVEGKIVSINDYAQDNKFILNFGKLASSDKKLGYFRVIISSSNVKSIANFLNLKFNSLKDLIGQNVKLKGILEVHQKKNRCYPQFFLKYPSLKIANNQIKTNKLAAKTVNHNSTQSKSTKNYYQYSPKTKPAKTAHLTSALPQNQLAETYYKDGLALAKLGDCLGAIDAYNRSLVLDPNNALVYRSRGNAYVRTDNYYKAINNYDQALRLDPRDGIVYYNRGIVREKLGDKQGAIDNFLKAENLGIQSARRKLRQLGR
ncbi:tetratricopeptide repeat protein [Leptolyngbya sp. ST-U4]|uniref:tetratricopeptide repeat protein n=1 Tax=Leptolyngbya sp. ST-U4 TaxID=2933912 RepID=UPI003298560C